MTKRSQDMIERRIRAGKDEGVPPFLAGATEHAFDLTVVDFAIHRGWSLTYHTHDSRKSEAGFPDRVFLHEAWRRIIFVELKDMIRLVTPGQVEWLNGLMTIGQECGVWRPSDWDEIERVLSSPDARLLPGHFPSAWPNGREIQMLQRRAANSRKRSIPRNARFLRSS